MYGAAWVVGLAVQVLRRSAPEALVWVGTAAALALRGVSRWCAAQTPSASSSISSVILEGLVPVGLLAWQSGHRGGFLWQLAPLAPIIVALLPTGIELVRLGPVGWWLSWSLGWLLVVVSLVALLAFPPAPFPPRPTTRISIAEDPRNPSTDRRIYDVGFRHGEEDLGEDAPKRAFYVWYPASKASPPATNASQDSGASHYFPQYASQMELMFESMQYRLPTVALLFSHLRSVRADTLADAPVLVPSSSSTSTSTSSVDAGGRRRWPVIVFSHGLYGFPSLYTHICSSLASLGYVVMAVGHTDGSGNIVSPASGEIITAFEPLPTSPSGKEIGGHELWAFRHRQLGVRVDDLEACLDILQRWNSDPDKAMDLEKVALAGHSFGGGTSLGLVLREAEARSSGKGQREREGRVRSAILLDGWMYPLEGSEGPAFDRTIPARCFEAAVPVLFINAETWQGSETYCKLNKERIRQLCELSGGRWRSFTFKGTGHHNWNDFPFYAPIISRLVGLTRELDLTTAHEDTLALVDAFLADTVLGSPVPEDRDATERLPHLDHALSSLGPEGLPLAGQPSAPAVPGTGQPWRDSDPYPTALQVSVTVPFQVPFSAEWVPFSAELPLHAPKDTLPSPQALQVSVQVQVQVQVAPLHEGGLQVSQAAKVAVQVSKEALVRLAHEDFAGPCPVPAAAVSVSVPFTLQDPWTPVKPSPLCGP